MRSYDVNSRICLDRHLQHLLCNYFQSHLWFLFWSCEYSLSEYYGTFNAGLESLRCSFRHVLFANITWSFDWDTNCRGTSPQRVDFFEVVRRVFAGGLIYNSLIFKGYDVRVEFKN